MSADQPTDREIIAALVKELRDLRARFHRALIYDGCVQEFADAAVALKLAERGQ